jgi:hypothetical protein
MIKIRPVIPYTIINLVYWCTEGEIMFASITRKP